MRSKLLNVVLCLFVLLLCFVVAELVIPYSTDSVAFGSKSYPDSSGFRITCYSSDPDHYFQINLRYIEDREYLKQHLLGSEEQKDETARRLAEQTPYCLINSTARRGPGFYPEREETVMLMGDSFAFGEGVRDQHTLQYLLGEQYPKYNFSSSAWPGFDIQQISSLVLDERYKPKKLKAIIYFYNLNDVLMSETLRKEKQLVTDFQNVFTHAVKPKEIGFESSLFGSSRLLSLLKRVWFMKKQSKETIAHYQRRYFSPDNADKLLESLALLEDMNEKLKERGVEFYVALYPLLHKDFLGNYPFENIHQLLLSFCVEKGIRCVDALGAFSDVRSMTQFKVHAVDYHPNAEANSRVAKYLSTQKEFLQ